MRCVAVLVIILSLAAAAEEGTQDPSVEIQREDYGEDYNVDSRSGDSDYDSQNDDYELDDDDDELDLNRSGRGLEDSNKYDEAVIAAIRSFYDVYSRHASMIYENKSASFNHGHLEDIETEAKNAYYITFFLVYNQKCAEKKQLSSEQNQEKASQKNAEYLENDQDFSAIEPDFSVDRQGSPDNGPSLSEKEQVVPEVFLENKQGFNEVDQISANYQVAAASRASQAYENLEKLTNEANEVAATVKAGQESEQYVPEEPYNRQSDEAVSAVAALKAGQEYADNISNNGNGVGAAARASQAYAKAAFYANDPYSAAAAYRASEHYAQAAKKANDPDAVAAAIRAGNEYAAHLAEQPHEAQAGKDSAADRTSQDDASSVQESSRSSDADNLIQKFSLDDGEDYAD